MRGGLGAERALIARWFADRRGTVMGLAFSGMGMGVLVHRPACPVAHRDARLAWRATSPWERGTLAVLVPLTWFARARRSGSEARREPRRIARREAAGADHEARGALSTRAFWALFFAYLCTPLAVFPVVTHQVAFAVDQGFPRMFVAGIFGLVGRCRSWAGSCSASRPIGSVARPRRACSYACTALGTLCLLGLETWRHSAPLYAYALLFGLGFGARGPIITAMASALFQVRRFGVIYGILSIGTGWAAPSGRGSAA